MSVFKRLGLKPITLKEYREAVELPYMKFYRKFTNAPREKIERLYKEEIVLARKPKPFSGVKEVLEYLHSFRIRMVVLSSNFQELLEEEVKEYGFQNFFVEVKGDVYDKRKAILGLLNKNNLITGIPKENLVVGDMVHDIEAGKEIDALTAAITWGFQPREKLVSANPDFFIDDIMELKNIIKRHS